MSKLIEKYAPKIRKKRTKNKFQFLIIIFCALFVAIGLAPDATYLKEHSKVVYDRNGNLLSASIADDGQWRFPVQNTIPQELEECILTFEDEYFYQHFGVNPVSMIKAIRDNIKAGRIVRGGSTITMQVMRMHFGNEKRTVIQKIKEIFGAFKLELCNSKKDILHAWASRAPFGGNTVGAQTAAIRYYNRPLEKLSWSEYATLAVLPNSPSVIHLEKNREALLQKRNNLLDKLYKKNNIDSITWILAKDESLPKFKSYIEQKGIHFLELMKKEFPEKSMFHSTIDPYLQESTQRILNEYASVYQHDGIQNIAAVVIDNQANEVLAYIGNVNNTNGNIQYVDCAQGLRSYGSLLKPFLYTHAIESGYFLPQEIIKDIPTNINGYSPKNFDKKYRGIVPMSDMVTYSLNIPAVRVLNYVGLTGFNFHLRNDLNLQSINVDPDHHGLSLILGGAESNLWNMARLYKGLIRNHYQHPQPFADIKTCQYDPVRDNEFTYAPSTVWHTLSAMKNVNRPREEQQYSKLMGDEVAWKTGTSYGHRDAWAIGCNERYTVAVWVGNQTGEGMYNLTGATKAAPVLFRIFRSLPSSGVIKENLTEAESVTYCTESGKLQGRYCKATKTAFVPSVAHMLRNCDHHEISGKDTVFVLDPVLSYYQNNFNGTSTKTRAKQQRIKIVYPTTKSIIQLPKKLDDTYAKLTATAYTNYDTSLFWFLNGKYITKTAGTHEIQIPLQDGKNKITITDTNGNQDEVDFENASL